MNFLTVLLAVAALITIEAQSTESQCNSTAPIDNYVKLNRLQYEYNIANYDSQIDNFILSYNERLNGMNMDKDLLIDSIMQFEGSLGPLEVLSDFSKACVNKYRKSIPSVATTKTAIEYCISTAANQQSNLISAPTVTRNSLQYYYTTTFENAVLNCAQRYPNSIQEYNLCNTEAISAANTYTKNSQKTFESQMDASRYAGNSNIKIALQCSYTAEESAISTLAETKVNLDRCLEGVDGIPRGYTCNETTYVKKSEVDYTHSTMTNPLYNRYDFNSDCLTMIFN